MSATRPVHWRYRQTEAHARVRSARDFLVRHRTDHERAYAGFRWPRLTHFNWALEWFDVVARNNPAPALELFDADGGRRVVSYAALSARSDTVATWLTERGVRRGERVLLVLGTRPELWESVLACLKIGAVVIPTYPTLTPAEARNRVRRGGIRHVVCRAGLAGVFAGVPVAGRRIAVDGNPGAGWLAYPGPDAPERPFLPTGPTPAGDLAFGYFTSGTTSEPKLVAHTHVSYPVGHLSSLYFNGLVPGDRHLNMSAPGWAKHSWSSLFVPFAAEATVLALPDGPPVPAQVAATLVDARVTSFCAPPNVWQQLRPYLDLRRPALREATSAGEPLDAALADEVAQTWGVRIRDGYGQTETTGLIGTTPGLTPRPGWLGLPLPGYRISLRDPQTGAPGDTGEVCVDLADAPVGMMAGYADDPDRTARVLGRGWYGTGDLGERDPDGWIRVLGRRDDVFKWYGHRISPYELERVLRSHSSVADVAVVGVPHPVGGAQPQAMVLLRSGIPPGDRLATELLHHAAGRLAPELRPRSICFVDSLPRTASGKVRRSALSRIGDADPDPLRRIGAADPAAFRKDDAV
ncbi:MAG: hypothetical protein AUI10_07120 [Actinobacteria bacterium 13_2_20CM_2_72_6]|nr:MAG: hypothetical protein AUI10_07120 [Actinobacteria bacterium 13_2_20CM_2_72_6]